MLAGKLLPLGGSRPLPTFVSSSIAASVLNTTTVTAPSGIQDGDLLVAVGVIDNSGDILVTPPSGFNLMSRQLSSGTGLSFVATKTAASESGNYTFTFGSGVRNNVSILVYRNATRVNTVGSVAFIGANPSITATSITPTYRGILVAAFSCSNANSTVSTPPSGMTQRAVLTGQSVQLAVYDLSPQEAAATGSKTLVWSAAKDQTGTLLQITNEPDIEPDFVAMAQTQNTSSSTSLIINKPTGTVEGDLMVAVMSSSGGGLWSGDTGWSEVCDQGAAPNLRIAYKAAGNSEPSTYTFSSASASSTLSGAILTYRYAAYDTIAGSFTTGADPLVLTSISPSASQSILIAAGARSAASVTLGTPTSMTARATDNDANQVSYIVCDQSVAAGPTGTRSMSTGSTTSVAGIMLSIKPTRSL